MKCSDSERSRCTKCNQMKLVTEFYKHTTPRGYSSWCKECTKAQGRIYYKRNAERLSMRGRQHFHAHSERWRAYRKRWNAAHKDEVAQANHARRAVQNGVMTDRVMLSEVYEKFGGICGICGKPVSRQKATLDHMIPLSRGGPHVMDNAQPAHRLCNYKKGNRLAGEM